MKTKKKRVSEERAGTAALRARSQGGDISRDCEMQPVSRKQKPGEPSPASDTCGAGPAAVDGCNDTEPKFASRKNTRSENGDSFCGADTPAAARSKSKSRSMVVMPSMRVLTGQGGVSGEPGRDADYSPATRRRKTRQTNRTSAPIDFMSGKGDGEPACVTERCVAVAPIQELQRRRTALLKARIAIDNQLAAVVSTELGYRANLEEKERKGLRAEATKLIAAIVEGHELNGHAAIASRVAPLVLNVSKVSEAFDADLKAIEKAMVKAAESLPVAKWCNGVRGFGLKSLAIIIGETGDLSLYANPGKVWKRLGCAPIQSKGKVLMPSTWRRKGGLSAEEWTAAGYSPRRRSLMYVVGECLVKQNDGAYRARYDEAKAAKLALNDEEWTKLRCHNHGMLLAAKRLVRDLWKEWRAACPR